MVHGKFWVITQLLIHIQLIWGIPTDWNNPNHIKRKIKFQSLLIASVELSNQFDNLEIFINTKERELLQVINIINENHLRDN